MMTQPLDEYSYLWDGSEPEWALARLEAAPGVPMRYVIVHTGDRQALIIDDEEAHRQVVERMLAENVRVLTDFSAWAP